MKCVTVTAIQQQTLIYFLKIRTHFTIRLESELVAMFIPVTSFKQLEALKFQLCAVKDVCTIVRVLMWNTVVPFAFILPLQDIIKFLPSLILTLLITTMNYYELAFTWILLLACSSSKMKLYLILPKILKC